jgi:hypothetical protein
MVNINQLNPSYLSLGNALLTSTASAANLAKVGISTPYTGFSGTIAQALRPFPQYSTLTSLGAKVGASSYNAGQIVYRIRPTHGISVNANYTYSKLMGYSSTTLEGNTGTDNTVQNAYNPRADYSILPNDVRHALVLSSSYELPFGKGRAFLKGNPGSALAGGWTVSAIQRYQSGFPLSILMSSNSLPIFNYYQRPNLVPGVDPSSHTPNGKFNPAAGSNIFNPAAFAAPGNNSFGNASPAYSNLRNYPVLAEEDLAANKSTSLGEHLVRTFYAQAFNAFNRHRFTGFGTSFGSSSFGQPNATNAARAIQFGSRLQF